MTQEHLKKVDLTLELPQHVGIILDGNGRWAKQHNKATIKGHYAGIRAVRKTVEYAIDIKLKCLSLYAFSQENWKRSHQEVSSLMEVFLTLLIKRKSYLNKNQIKVTFIGELSGLNSYLQQEIIKTQDLTYNNKGLHLVIAVNYSGQWDIVNACNSLQQQGLAATAENINNNLSTAEMPDLDLLIRTSGEQRLSNFFLWQAAYSELVFLDQLWPDFNKELFSHALSLFQSRTRNFGSRVN